MRIHKAPESWAFDQEGNVVSKGTYGTPIPGSIYVRSYCQCCGDPLRMAPQEHWSQYTHAVCEGCDQGEGHRHNASIRAHESRPFGQIIGMSKTSS